VTTARSASERALILAPLGRDAEIAAQIVAEAGCAAFSCADIVELVAEIECGAGVAIVSEEAFRHVALQPLAQYLARQPPWSDFPFVLLTQRGGGPEKNPAAVRLAALLGNVTFLERPFHPATLANMVNTAVRGRRRQYEARSKLEALAESERRLSELTATLERRVGERTQQLVAEVAAREEAQSQLLQAQKMESLGQLTGGVAHDFNNLLVAVMSNLELLADRIGDDARARSLVEGAMQGALRGASLTRRMLAFARQQSLTTRPTHLEKLVGGMRDLIARTLTSVITVNVDIPEHLPAVDIDATQVELAVLNLLINARDAGAGEITIRALVETPERPPPGGSRSYVCLRVIDSGSGMDAATLQKATEPFFSTKPPGRGTGLGLSMVHGVAEQLGGALRLSSEPGKGTTVSLYLPAAEAQPDVRESDVAVVQPGHSANVLLVDDDPIVASVTRLLLEDLGHRVVDAASGSEALRKMDSDGPFDLVITDHAMPGMTGLQLRELLRERCPGLPVLLITGYAEPLDSAPETPSLLKPYRRADMDAAIRTLLGAAPNRGALRAAGAGDPPGMGSERGARASHRRPIERPSGRDARNP
jgi:signal transduction histidine kinase/CheY-like chemotaxis protein